MPSDRVRGSHIPVAFGAEPFAVLIDELKPVAAHIALVCGSRTKFVPDPTEDVVELTVHDAGHLTHGHVLAAGFTMPAPVLGHPGDGPAAVQARRSGGHR